MNRTLHRIVFNRKRGLWMAAAETASGQGKGGQGPASHGAAWALVLLGLVPAAAVGQIHADPSAPAQQRATVLAAPNGVPLVNIQTPSAAGVSRNIYRQFDVDGQGAILNNSRTRIRSELGGWVEGNPWLARGPARILLNEVRSADPSQLRGPVEVAGERAELVIANPAGIQVDGAGFINASQVTLTTGEPRLTDGRLEGFQVRQGSVTVDGKGLDTGSADYTRILARAFRLNAGLWARDVLVLTGLNDVRSDATAVPQAVPSPAGAPAAPQIAIDVSQLGGMYAGKIRLVGTEAGVGVRQDGILSASDGDLVIDHSGWLSLGGHTQSSASVRIAAVGDITHGGVTVAEQTVSMHTGQHLLNTGRIAGRRLDIEADSLSNRGPAPSGGEIWQTGTQDLVVQAGTLQNSSTGRIGEMAARVPSGTGDAPDASAPPAPEDGAASAPDPTAAIETPVAQDGLAPEPLPAGRVVVRRLLDNTGGTLGAQGTTDLRVSQGLDNAGELVVRHVQVDGGRFDNREGALLQATTLGIHAEGAANAGRVTVTGDATVHVAARFDNSGGWQAGQDLTVVANAFANQGVLLANQQLDIRAQTLEAVGIVAAGGDLSLALAQPLAVRQGERVLAQGDLRLALDGAVLTNAGQLQAGKTLVLSAMAIDNQASGDIHAATTRIRAQQAFTNRGVVDGERTEIEAADLRNIGTGRLYGNDIAIAAVTLLNDSETVGAATTAATIAARTRLDIGARHITNREGALIFSAGSLQVGGALDAQGHAVGEAETLDNHSATIESLGDMRLAARTLRNTNAHFASELRVTSGPTAMTLIQPQGRSVRLAEGNLYRSYWDRAWDYRYDTTPDPYQGVPLQLGATPIPAVGEARCTDPADPSTCARLPGADYLPHDPSWAYFGLTPPAAEPVPPSLAEPVPPPSLSRPRGPTRPGTATARNAPPMTRPGSSTRRTMHSGTSRPNGPTPSSTHGSRPTTSSSRAMPFASGPSTTSNAPSSRARSRAACPARSWRAARSNWRASRS